MKRTADSTYSNDLTPFELPSKTKISINAPKVTDITEAEAPHSKLPKMRPGQLPQLLEPGSFNASQASHLQPLPVSTFGNQRNQFEVPLITLAPDNTFKVNNTALNGVHNFSEPLLRSGHPPQLLEFNASTAPPVNSGRLLYELSALPNYPAVQDTQNTPYILGRPGPAFEAAFEADRRMRLAERGNINSHVDADLNGFINPSHLTQPLTGTVNDHSRSSVGISNDAARPQLVQCNFGSIESCNSALRKAVELNDITTVNRLMQNSDFRNALGKKKILDTYNPLTDAIAKGHDNIAKALLKNQELGIKLAQHSNGHREDLPILIAIKLGKTDIVNALLDVDKRLLFRLSVRRGYIIHAAVEAGNIAVVRTLLARGDIDAQTCKVDQNGCNPIIVSAKLGYADIVELLLQQNNAAKQLKQTDQTGKNALAYARSHENDNVKNLILAFQNKERQEKYRPFTAAPTNASGNTYADYAISTADFYNLFSAIPSMKKPDM